MTPAVADSDAAHVLVRALARGGVEHVAGVPCSLLQPIVTAAAERLRYVAASVEGEALAMMAGAWLGGSLGAITIQNSGLGNVVNPLASLCLPYEIPVLLVVSWRGEPGTVDAVHHAPMGAATLPLLSLFELPHVVLRGESDVDAEISSLLASMRERRRPAALVVPRGVLAKPRVREAPAPTRSPPLERTPVVTFGTRGGATPPRATLVDRVVRLAADDMIVGTTGHMARDLAARSASPLHFPMQGSMGFASAIALGASLAAPRARAVVLDGDGALLMRMGTLSTIGATRPERLVHIVADNGTYASTGGQPTASANVDFGEIAAACGYARAASCIAEDGLDAALSWVFAERGPTFLHVAIDAREAAAADRPERPPPEIARAFRAACERA